MVVFVVIIFQMPVTHLPALLCCSILTFIDR